jgi:sulfite exporter TauE/SafE
MVALSLSASAGEALVLGLATGPVCLASCGPVVVPWLLVQPKGVGVHSRQLSLFLLARLAGYLAFAALVWYAGSLIPRSWTGRSWLFGCIELLLAAALVFYAAGWPRRHCSLVKPSSRLVQIGEAPAPRITGALALGFLTGINLCPPFLVAGVRAAQLPALSASLLFFLFFFAGTAVWFVPFLSLGFVRRTPALVTVARMVAVLLACWYGVSGVTKLIERALYG